MRNVAAGRSPRRAERSRRTDVLAALPLARQRARARQPGRAPVDPVLGPPRRPSPICRRAIGRPTGRRRWTARATLSADLVERRIRPLELSERTRAEAWCCSRSRRRPQPKAARSCRPRASTCARTWRRSRKPDPPGAVARQWHRGPRRAAVGAAPDDAGREAAQVRHQRRRRRVGILTREVRAAPQSGVAGRDACHAHGHGTDLAPLDRQ